MPRRAVLQGGYWVLPRRVGFLPLACLCVGGVQYAWAVALKHTHTEPWGLLYIGDPLESSRSILDLHYNWHHLCPPLLLSVLIDVGLNTRTPFTHAPYNSSSSSSFFVDLYYFDVFEPNCLENDWSEIPVSAESPQHEGCTSFVCVREWVYVWERTFHRFSPFLRKEGKHQKQMYSTHTHTDFAVTL